MRKIIFEPSAFDEYNEWVLENRTIVKKLAKLINEIARHPFEGTGKPEPLRHQFHGCWSRRLTDEHRIVYKVNENYIIIVSCKYHYE